MKIITKVVDSLHPETRAMIQAFYSRSHMGIEERLADLGDSEEKIKHSLNKYYVQYGHQSVGELSSITVFLEDISMLAAKAIQDFPLYRGQEGSTRYIDYSNQPFIIPPSTDNNLQEVYRFWGDRFREFYTRAYPQVVEDLKLKHPGDGKVYEKTISAKAFDILRGFLPAGFSTKVAWTGSFRDIGEHLRKLLNHPLDEVKIIADTTYKKLLEDYPNSFRPLRDSDFFENNYFYNTSIENPGSRVFISDFDKNRLPKYDVNNPLFDVVTIHSDCVMDFASWRDLQRHRKNKYFFPLLTTKIGVETFYVDNLPDSLKEEACKLLAEVSFCLDTAEPNVYNRQYAIPMCFLCNIMMSFDLHQAKYLAELRSKKTVHQTLRWWAQDLGRFLKKRFDIEADVDYEEESFTLKRGNQDIIKKD